MLGNAFRYWLLPVAASIAVNVLVRLTTGADLTADVAGALVYVGLTLRALYKR